MQFPLDCPYCKTKNVGTTVHAIEAQVDKKEKGVLSVFSTCNNCQHGLVGNVGIYADVARRIQMYRTWDYKANFITGTFPDLFDELEWQPEAPKPDIPDSLPPQVLTAYLDAENLYLLGAYYNACGTAYRRVIDIALPIAAQEENNKNLNARIKSMADSGKLTQALAAFAHRIRALGNEATHASFEFQQKDVEDIRLLTKMLMLYLFTLPAMLPKPETKSPEPSL